VLVSACDELSRVDFVLRISDLVAATRLSGRLSLIHPKPFIIPIFLPQWGCPYRCIYCHQEKITQTRRQEIHRADFSTLVESGLNSRRRTPDRRVELAFYGGTFTLLPAPVRDDLLAWAAAYIRQGRVEAIRLSTRPDALSEEVLLNLKAAGVETVELGVQSLNDQALVRSKRGHSARDSFKAVRLLRKFFFRVGIQLMAGLPGDTPEGFHQTIREVRDLKPDLVRIYPTVVFPETVLAQWVEKGRYTPLALEEAVSLCRWAVDLLETAGIPVIRLGLQSHDRMSQGKDILAGAYHPAFGDLVRGELFLMKIKQDLAGRNSFRETDLALWVAGRDIGFLTGNKGKNLKKLKTDLGISQLQVNADPVLPRGAWQLRPARSSEVVTY
jgi:histone acetyltransferase (RNA polymerase elongator complex component)